MKICVVGLGEIGSAVFKRLVLNNKEKKNKIYGVDKDKSKCTPKNTGTKLVKAEVYCICVYTTEQVLEVVRKIKAVAENPLIIVESTVEEGTYQEIMKIMGTKDYGLVLFPHRFNPGDPKHAVFNLWRVAGAIDEQSWNRFEEFYKQYTWKVHRTTPQIAEICKPIENAIRFIEIALAEEICLECRKKGISMRELRKAINTKWNIDLKEARNGIGGKCLPKDAKITSKLFDLGILKAAMDADEKYKKVQELR